MECIVKERAILLSPVLKCPFANIANVIYMLRNTIMVALIAPAWVVVACYLLVLTELLWESVIETQVRTRVGAIALPLGQQAKL